MATPSPADQSPSDRSRYDVFISYSRRDSTFVRQLWQQFQAEQRLAWVDWEDIPSLAKWRDEIQQGILAADNFVFVLSPDAVASSECRKELDCAIANNKRLVPIVCRGVNPQEVLPALGEINWIFFLTTDEFDTAFQRLITALDTNLDYIRAHTRLLTQAHEWQRCDRESSFLLRGQALATVEQEVLPAQDPQPPLTQLQRDYIAASRATETQRQQRESRHQQIALVAISTVLALVTGLGLLAEARRRQAVVGEVTALNAVAATKLTQGDQFTALLTSLKAGSRIQAARWINPKIRQETLSTLAQSIYWVREQNQLQGHPDWIRALAYSPTGDLLASGDLKGQIHLWQPDGTPVLNFTGHGGEQVWDLQFSPDGQQFATAGTDQQIHLWNRQGEQIRSFQGHSELVTSLSFSPNGQQIASGSDDDTVRLWRLDGTPLQVLKGHTSNVTSVQFAANGEYLVSGSLDGTVRLWRPNGEPVRTLTLPNTPVHDVALSPNGQFIAAATDNHQIGLWRLDGTLITQLQGHTSSVQAIAFSPDSQHLASVGDDRTLRLWRVDGTPLQTLIGHQASIHTVAFSPDGHHLATASDDLTLRLWQWQVPYLTQLVGHTDEINTLAFNPTGSQLISGSKDGSLRLWPLTGPGPDINSQMLAQTPDPLLTVDVSPDNQWVLTGSDNPEGISTLSLWPLNRPADTPAGTPVGSPPGSPVGQRQPRQFKTSHLQISQAIFSPDGQQILSADYQGQLQRWQLDGKLLPSWQQENAINDASFTAQPDQVATAGIGGIQFWRLGQNSAVNALQIEGEIYSLSLSPRGEWAFAQDQRVGLWTGDQTPPRYFTGHQAEIYAVQFSPDGDRIVSASPDRTLRLWNRQGQLLATLSDLHHEVWEVQFSPDGRHVASSGSGPDILVWDVSILDLETLTRISCDWLADYLRTHADDHLEEKQFCRV